MYYIAFLLLFPVIAAAFFLISKNYAYRKVLTIISGAAICGAAIAFSVEKFFSSSNDFHVAESAGTQGINIFFLIVELALMAYIVYASIKHKKYYAAVLSVVQTAIIFWLELSGITEDVADKREYLYIDKLSIMMCCLIAIVGCLICIYAVDYMKSYHQHHKEYGDRTRMFFPLLFVFLAAMFGIVFSDNLIWLFFFWEITTFASFMLIGYTKTPEAVNNSFRALWMNLLGGVCFAAAIAYCALKLDTVSLYTLVHSASGKTVMIPVILLCAACLVKSAQLPFSQWLLGAMVAPTPTSALLHSATMVKAGVYLLIRLSPLLAGNVAGLMVTVIGGFTFAAAAFLAISQSDAKKVLAYSTISNLGLITACAGVGLSESVWAAMLLIIFHAVSKSLMFLSVGAVENSLGSRSIEDMHGLIIKLPALAFVMIIGIAGMFLAPFGMLISKWAALKSFVDSNSVLLILFVVFGSAATLFYWTKWMSTMVAEAKQSERLKDETKSMEFFSLIVHSVIMILLCFLFPLASQYLIVPFLQELFGEPVPAILSEGNIHIMTFMMCMIFIVPLMLRVLAMHTKTKSRETTSYMCGINAGDDRHFTDSFGQSHKLYLTNWYMDGIFGEKRLLKPSLILSTVLLVSLAVIGIGGAL